MTSIVGTELMASALDEEATLSGNTIKALINVLVAQADEIIADKESIIDAVQATFKAGIFSNIVIVPEEIPEETNDGDDDMSDDTDDPDATEDEEEPQTQIVIIPYDFVPLSCMGMTNLIETSIDTSENADEVVDFDQTEKLAGLLPVDYLPYGQEYCVNIRQGNQVFVNSIEMEYADASGTNKFKVEKLGVVEDEEEVSNSVPICREEVWATREFPSKVLVKKTDTEIATISFQYADNMGDDYTYALGITNNDASNQLVEEEIEFSETSTWVGYYG